MKTDIQKIAQEWAESNGYLDDGSNEEQGFIEGYSYLHRKVYDIISYDDIDEDEKIRKIFDLL
jgi:hypothetical protein